MAPKTRRATQMAQRSSPASPPKSGSDKLNFTEKDFAERYTLFQKKPILPLLLIDLEALKPFGLDMAVDNLIVSPEWRHMLFDFKENIHIDLVHEVMATLKVHRLFNVPSALAISFRLGSQIMHFTMDDLSRLLNFDALQGYSPEANFERLTFLRNENEFKDEIAIAQGSLKASQVHHNITVTFKKEEYKVIQYVLSRSICGRDAGSKVSTMDYLCLYGIIKQVPIHMGVVVAHLFRSQFQPQVPSIYVGPFITRIVQNCGYQIPLKNPIVGSFRMLTPTALVNTLKRSLLGQKVKSPRTSGTEDGGINEEVDHMFDEAEGSGANLAEEGLSHFEKQLLGRLDIMQEKQQDQRVAISQLAEGIANLQTLVVEIRSFFPVEQHASSRAVLYPHEHFYPRRGPYQYGDPGSRSL